MPAPRLFLIDSFGFIFRAYHARARSGAPPMRTTTGLSTEAVFIFGNMLRKLMTSFKPDYIAAVFESTEPTFRSESFAEYKANRAEMPHDLGPQIPYCRRLLEALNIPVLQFPNFEADDVIGAISCREHPKPLEVVIVSSDKDMLQLVNDRVFMLNPMKDDEWYDAAKVEEFMGVKPTQVADLLALKGDSIDNIPGAPGIGDKGAKDIITRFGSVEAALDRAAEVERKMYRESLLNHREQILLSKQLATIHTGVPIEWELPALRSQPPNNSALKGLYKELEFFSLLKDLAPEDDSSTRDYTTLNDDEAITGWLSKRPSDSPLAIALDSTNGFIGLAYRMGEGRAIPFANLEILRSSLESEAIPKIVHDLKTFLPAILPLGVRPQNLAEDAMLYSFLLTADPGSCSPEMLAGRFLDRKLNAAAEQQAEATLSVVNMLRPQIAAQELTGVYHDVDLPLAPVLAEMENTGIRVDTDVLAELSIRLSERIDKIAEQVYVVAGRSFNINSPQQLGKVLFEEMNLRAPVKYGKGKTISTAADILEGLAAENPVAQLVLDYRQLTKLKGTYIDALPQLIKSETGRVHTTFNQTGAATGRLSSSNPNLQNIPIRTEEGREIRAAFIPEEGWELLVADYSQIELRLLAHMSQDPVLLESFNNGEDIHTRTAAEVFKIDPLIVNADMRRSAKAVNFGIVYGQTPFGLAQTLCIDRKEAELYIRRYFERYAGVREFIDRTIAEVRQTGVAKTLIGRRRPIPDMQSRNPAARSFAERTAVNTPLQGTAADLIKLAMIRLAQAFKDRQMKSRMLLQVHDELVFETPPEEKTALGDLVKREMETVYQLSVPLLVEVGVGPNWRDAK
ncbi:MAG: DNA polymerase I [Acidobacteriota bacterium]|nr:DNA polymerase I [Acidobacteriota bacterium]MDQ2839653.1 DNA polymerase I [Acidobacteriota bacterium]